MKHYTYFFVKLALLLFGIFTFFRIVFTTIHLENEASSYWNLFTAGIRTDLSVISYISMIPFLLIIAHNFIKARRQLIEKILRLYLLFIIIVVSLVETASIGLYKEWGTILNSRALDYLGNIKTAGIGIFSPSNILLVVLILLSVAASFFILKRLVRFDDKKSNSKGLVTGTFCYIPLVILGVRGGPQHLPLSVSDTFFSSNQTENYIAVNNLFYFINDLEKTSNRESLVIEFEEEELIGQLSQKHFRDKSSAYNGTLKGQNLVVIILEGWLYQVLKNDQFAPYSYNLKQHSLDFTNVYSTGCRTDQGLLSIFSGVPAVPRKNIMSDFELSKNFPSLYEDFKDLGYNTSLYYGGDLNFSNIKAYFLKNKADRVVGENEFPKELNLMKWGVPDEHVFQKALEELDDNKSPFFSSILTLSSHPPFDLPGNEKHQGKPELDSVNYMKTITYMDKAIQEFIEGAKKKKWYNNTSFLFVADHGSLYLDVGYSDHRRFHIPCFIYNTKTHNNPKKVKHLGNHLDLPTTLLDLIGQRSDKYVFSRNLLQQNKEAFWCYGDNMGIITEDQKVIFNILSKKIYHNTNHLLPASRIVHEGRKNTQLIGDYVLNKKYLQEVIKNKLDSLKAPN